MIKEHPKGAPWRKAPACGSYRLPVYSVHPRYGRKCGYQRINADAKVILRAFTGNRDPESAADGPLDAGQTIIWQGGITVQIHPDI